MAAVSKKPVLQGICSLLMAALFALSTSFQFNDPDWYFWIPLYGSACTANLVSWAKPRSRIRQMVKFAFCLGVFLFIKVAIEAFLNRTTGFVTFDMRERVVREIFGSGLVIFSMFLLSETSSNPNRPTQVAKYGMPILVCVAYGLSFVFFVFQHHQMRF